MRSSTDRFSKHQPQETKVGAPPRLSRCLLKRHALHDWTRPPSPGSTFFLEVAPATCACGARLGFRNFACSSRYITASGSVIRSLQAVQELAVIPNAKTYTQSPCSTCSRRRIQVTVDGGRLPPVVCYVQTAEHQRLLAGRRGIRWFAVHPTVSPEP